MSATFQFDMRRMHCCSAAHVRVGHTCIFLGRPALLRRYQPQGRLEEGGAEEARADEEATGRRAAAGSSRIQDRCERERSCDGGHAVGNNSGGSYITRTTWRVAAEMSRRGHG